jgi:hypothetical protein
MVSLHRSCLERKAASYLARHIVRQHVATSELRPEV